MGVTQRVARVRLRQRRGATSTETYPSCWAVRRVWGSGTGCGTLVAGPCRPLLVRTSRPSTRSSTVATCRTTVASPLSPPHPSSTLSTLSVSSTTHSTPWVKKTRHLTLAVLTDFQNSFTVRLSRKFVTNAPPHPKRVATLPCKISGFKKSPFLKE